MLFGFKKQKPRRSEIRLGKRAAAYQATTMQPRLSLGPLMMTLQTRQTKIGALLVIAVVIMGLYMLFTTPTFFVYRADISGQEAVSVREIYLASEIDSQSIFWLSAPTIAANIERLPNIKTAQVNIALPANITIMVTERQPEVLWQSGEAVWWIDAEGTVVPPRGDTEGMLRIIDNDQQPLEVGYQIDPTIIRGAQKLQLLVPNLTEIQHSRAKGLTVASPEGWPVYLGDGSEMRGKLVTLTALLAYIRTESISPVYLDVRNPLQPVFKEKPVIAIEQPVPQHYPARYPRFPAPPPARP